MNEGEPYVCLIDMIRSSRLTGWAEGKVVGRFCAKNEALVQ